MSESSASQRRIHLDLIGGLAGDMFAAAVMDAHPVLALPLLRLLRSLPLPAGVVARFDETSRDGLKGLRFVVPHPGRTEPPHVHRPYKDVRRWLLDAPLPAGVRDHALELFRTLAEAEGAVHGVAPDDVEFHEVGALDSICDFVAAAFLLDALGANGWTWSPVPLGSGRVKCAHGVMPVPAPATARLLAGMRVLDDGVPGERVTPTGAAVLKYLSGYGTPGGTPPLGEQVLRATGIGHGTRTLRGVPNIVRCMVFELQSIQTAAPGEIASLQFEVDDQSPEDLAVGLDHLRALPGVLEIYQVPVFAKKSRVAVQVQVLLESWSVEAVSDACFNETTTLGLRMASVRRRTLPRRVAGVSENVRVKVAHRPGGVTTGKAEMDDLAGTTGHSARQAVRSRAEEAALTGETP